MTVSPYALPAQMQARLDTRRADLRAFGDHCRWLPRTSSTNDEAMRFAQAGAPEGAWVVADQQTAGRGRRGRAWASPPGAGVYLSVVFQPREQRSDPPTDDPRIDAHHDPATALLTLMAGVAVADGIRAATGLSLALKWPNDVVVDATGRKVAGILAEATTSGAVLQLVILGIGINLAPASHPPDVAARAVSLEELAGRRVDRDVVLVEVLAALARERVQLLHGGASALLDAWRALAPSCRGRRVSWNAADDRRSGTTAGIDATGALLVTTPFGTERIVAGELSWE